MSKSGKLGYIAPFPLADILSGLNAFTLGARMINPRAEIHIRWTLSWNKSSEAQRLTGELDSIGCDIISHHNTLANRQFSREYGVYTLKTNKEGELVPGKYLAVPVWNWGIFYEKYIRSVLSGGTRLGSDPSGSGSVRNYWWGMDSGLLDFFYAKKHVPGETQKLVEFMKTSLISQTYKVFSGPIYDIKGNLIVDDGEELQREQILSMDWLAKGIVGELPDMSKYRSIQELSTGKIV
jgi:basic membrane lipoprotein Med (substrate-binding protein (PBP1-ABC) superfamily)